LSARYPEPVTGSNAKKTVLFLLSVAVALAVSLAPLRELIRNGQPPDYYAHIPLVPLVSAYVLFRRWRTFSGSMPGSFFAGSAVIALGFGLFLVDRLSQPGLIGHAELSAGAAVLLLSGSFLALYGAQRFRKALFPLLFLWFVVPLPLSWMDVIVSALAGASAEFTRLFFVAIGVPFVQEGAIFRLPGFDIKVAHECSGIRSSLALLITSVLAGQIFLNRRWKKITLALAVFPVTVMKNAVRIVTLYLLSFFVDIRIIEGGFLHRSGGFLFFGLGLAVLVFVLWLLMGREKAGRNQLGKRLLP
jgi:exosortase